MTATQITFQNDVEEKCRKEGERDGQADLSIRDMPSQQVVEKIVLQMTAYFKLMYRCFTQQILSRLLQKFTNGY